MDVARTDGSPQSTSRTASGSESGTLAGQVTDTLPVDLVDPAQLVEEELLVEEVSIDGMCGVY